MTRWNALPREQCDGIKNYIVSLVIKTSSDEETMKREKTLLNKLNLILVQVLKQEWPKNWPTFIGEVVSASRSSLSLCENNMIILRLLSEEVFDFSAEQMTTIKAKNLKTQLCGEFSEVFQLCTEVLDKAQKPSLVLATLEALLGFLKWIPLGYIFETNLVESLLTRFLTIPTFRNVTIKCLTEVGSLSISSEYDGKFVSLFQGMLQALEAMIPYHSTLDLASVYHVSKDEDQKLIQNLSMFLSTCLGNHLKMLEAQVSHECLLLANNYLLKISLVEDREVFKICLEYWNKLVSGLYNEYPYTSSTGSLAEPEKSGGLFLGSSLLSINSSSTSTLPPSTGRRALYSEVLSNLRLVMIERMVKPEEVLIVEDENGEIVRERIKETNTIILYKSMREVLVYLTHLDYENTENIMTSKLSRQFDGSEWSWNNLNKLCWAIGSISGAMNEEVEKKFLVNIIRDLLGLTEMKRGKDNKAVVASNIMYIVGQYPRFLKSHWKFLKTVVNKLFEFMHEVHEGVQDMACDTLIKISLKCRRYFVTCQPGEQAPYIDEILERLDSIICDLQPSQVHSFYEAIGYMIQSQSDPALQKEEIALLMTSPNNCWDSIISTISKDTRTNLGNIDTLKSLSSVLRSNITACGSIGAGFDAQISTIFMDMLSLYRAVSGLINEAISLQGIIATKTPVVRAMRAVKKDILKLVEKFVEVADQLEALNEHFIPPLFDAILGDYKDNVEQARDAEVLSLTSTIIIKMGGSRMSGMVAPILQSVFECTLAMINRDLVEYPEHRISFFKLLQSTIENCFPSLLQLPPLQFKLVVDSILWAIKHTDRDISDMGLCMLHQIIQKMVEPEGRSMSSSFFRSFYLSLLQDIFYVLSDSDHKAGFKYQSAILATMFRLISEGIIDVPLWEESPKQSYADNRSYIDDYMLNLLKNAFPHLQQTQIQTFIRGLFDLNGDLPIFKDHLRDFLISLKEFSGDNQELYLEEEELERQRKTKADMENAMRIPGLIKPIDRGDFSD